MKRGLVVIVALAALAGCGGGSESAESPKEAALAVAQKYFNALIDHHEATVCELLTGKAKRELVGAVAVLNNGKGSLSCEETMKEVLGLYGEDDFIRAEEGLEELGLDDVTVNGTSAAILLPVSTEGPMSLEEVGGKWFVSDTGGSSSERAHLGAGLTKPVIVTPAQLSEAAGELGHPLYWAGEEEGSEIELTEPEPGRSYVRYLTEGAEAGDPRAKFLTVASYEFKGASEALEEQAEQPNGVHVSAPNEGFAYLDSRHPQSVYLAYPGEDAQIEVFDPNAGVAKELVTSGQIVPVP